VAASRKKSALAERRWTVTKNKLSGAPSLCSDAHHRRRFATVAGLGEGVGVTSALIICNEPGRRPGRRFRVSEVHVCGMTVAIGPRSDKGGKLPTPLRARGVAIER